jgi:lipopolysaccharide/colanic/teichoic acid biosynthesis glycosyltransferase
MNHFWKKLFLNRIQMKNILTSKDGWYSKKIFKNLLKKEVKRAFRTQSPLSYITIDLSQVVKMVSTGTKNEYQIFLKNILQMITKNTRTFDLKSFNNNAINILLIDTALSGAKKFTKKITEHLFEEAKLLEEENYINFFRAIRFSTYPLNRVAGSEEIKAKPIILNSQVGSRKVMNRYYMPRIESKSAISLSWDILPFSDGIVAMPDMFDSQISSNDLLRVSYKILERSIDIIASLFCIILFMPVFSIIAFMIKLSSPGSIFYKQKRIGYLGKPFTLYKFRSMRQMHNEISHEHYVKSLINNNLNQEELNNQKEQIKNQVTRIGQFIRKTSLDEIPQLLNILKGDMAIIGPRPHPQYEVQNYKLWYFHRLQIKPGLTGLSKIVIRDSAKNYDGSMRIDIWYLENRSALLNLKIIFNTISYVLKGTEAD